MNSSLQMLLDAVPGARCTADAVFDGVSTDSRNMPVTVRSARRIAAASVCSADGSLVTSCA